MTVFYFKGIKWNYSIISSSLDYFFISTWYPLHLKPNIKVTISPKNNWWMVVSTFLYNHDSFELSSSSKIISEQKVQHYNPPFNTFYSSNRLEISNKNLFLFIQQNNTLKKIMKKTIAFISFNTLNKLLVTNLLYSHSTSTLKILKHPFLIQKNSFLLQNLSFWFVFDYFLYSLGNAFPLLRNVPYKS